MMAPELTPGGLPVVTEDAAHGAFDRMGDFIHLIQDKATEKGDAIEAAIEHISQENPVVASKIHALISAFQEKWEEKVIEGKQFEEDDVNYINFGYLSVLILTYDLLRKQAELNQIETMMNP